MPPGQCPLDTHEGLLLCGRIQSLSPGLEWVTGSSSNSSAVPGLLVRAQQQPRTLHSLRVWGRGLACVAALGFFLALGGCRSLVQLQEDLPAVRYFRDRAELCPDTASIIPRPASGSATQACLERRPSR